MSFSVIFPRRNKMDPRPSYQGMQGPCLLSTIKLKNIGRILLWSIGKNHDGNLIADRDLSLAR